MKDIERDERRAFLPSGIQPSRCAGAELFWPERAPVAKVPGGWGEKVSSCNLKGFSGRKEGLGRGEGPQDGRSKPRVGNCGCK